MEIKKENIAPEIATDSLLKKYQDNNLVTYSISLSLLKSLLEAKIITEKDYSDSVTLLGQKHGLNPASLFVSNDLI